MDNTSSIESVKSHFSGSRITVNNFKQNIGNSANFFRIQLVSNPTDQNKQNIQLVRHNTSQKEEATKESKI